jgi:hypothetical protein
VRVISRSAKNSFSKGAKKQAIEKVDKMLWLINNKTEGPSVLYPIFYSLYSNFQSLILIKLPAHSLNKQDN